MCVFVCVRVCTHRYMDTHTYTHTHTHARAHSTHTHTHKVRKQDLSFPANQGAAERKVAVVLCGREGEKKIKN